MKSNYKKFAYIFISAITIFVLINALVWQFAMKKIFEPPNGCIVGDIARLGYDPTVINVRPPEILTLPKKHKLYTAKKDAKVDVLTFGDSFTRGGAGGKNPYFQDFIASYNDLNVYHVHDFKNHYNCVNTLLILIKNGMIDEIKPKYIVLESAQRECVRRLGHELDFNRFHSKKETKKLYSRLPEKPFNVVKNKKIEFINSGNWKYLLYEFLYKFNDRAFISKVYRLKLTKEYSDDPYMLIYKDDIRFIKYLNDKSVAKMNKNLNKIGKILADKGIKLYFMPTPDKFTLYNKYFKDRKKYPQSQFYEMMRKQDKQYYTFIDTLDILSKELDKGERDIYFADDTHWTSKAAEAIFKKVKFD